jgi:hypothetical protein
MTLEDRVTRLEARIDQLDRIEHELVGLRADVNRHAADHGATLGRILASLQDLQRRPSFHWPWER